MALLNRFSKLNDRGETGIFTFIVTKSVTRDFHRDATTKDFCFGYHRWAISFQRPTEKVLGVHLLLRNPSPSTACVVDFTLTLLNREHFSQNEVYSKKQAKFTITNSMQGVSRWIQMSDLMERNFSDETGEFLFELALSNMTTIFECDIQLNPATLNQYKTMLRSSGNTASVSHSASSSSASAGHVRPHGRGSDTGHHPIGGGGSAAAAGSAAGSERQPKRGQQQQQQLSSSAALGQPELINLETNYFTFGSFDWSLTIVPLVTTSTNNTNTNQHSQQQQDSSSLPSSNDESSGQLKEPVCRVYLNRLSGLDCLCRVKYRVILGHHQASDSRPAEFVDSRLLDQISDAAGRIRGYQFRNTNILKLISLKGQQQQQQNTSTTILNDNIQLHPTKSNHHHHHQSNSSSSSSALDLRVHIEMFCANTISEARVPLQRKTNEPQVSNCSDRNKQAWCVESDSENETVRLKLFFMDLQSVPRNHIRYISWIAYVVRRDSKSGSMKESMAVKNSPHCNYYLQDGIDMGTIMDTHIPVKELNETPRSYLDANQLTVHIEWVDSLLLFSHLYNNYDSLATIQRHQIKRELSALQLEFAHLERKYLQSKRSIRQILGSGGAGNRQQAAAAAAAATKLNGNNNNNQSSPQSNSLDDDEELDEEDEEDDVLDELEEEEEAEMEEGDLKDWPRQFNSRPVAAAVGQPTSSFSQSLPMPQQLSATKSAAYLTARHHQQQQPQRQPGGNIVVGPPAATASAQRAPMSVDERLKFSSSTPPSGSHLHHHHHHHHQQQHHQQAPLRPLTGQQQVRRRLPCQPAPQPIPPPTKLVNAAAHQDSQSTYQQAPPPPPQIRAAAANEPTALMLEAKMGAVTLGGVGGQGLATSAAVVDVDNGSINATAEHRQATQQHAVYSSGGGLLPSAEQHQQQRHSMNMLMKLGGQPEVARYQQQQQQQQQRGFAAYEPQQLVSDEPVATVDGYYHHRRSDHQDSSGAPNQQNRFAAEPQPPPSKPLNHELELLYVTAATAPTAAGQATNSLTASQQQQLTQPPPPSGGYQDGGLLQPSQLDLQLSRKNSLVGFEPLPRAKLQLTALESGGIGGVGVGYALNPLGRNIQTTNNLDLFSTSTDPQQHFIEQHHHRPSY